MKKKENIKNKKQSKEIEISIPFKYDITNYGADLDVKGLVNRIEIGDIFVPPFQRKYIWNKKDASQFVESLLFGLPVPGIFLSKEKKTNKLLVIDGQQRLMSLYYFYKGYWVNEKNEFELGDVQKDFLGKTYQTLKPDERRNLDNYLIHATIIEQTSPAKDSSSIYYIFERLNTRGKRLSDQEIRASIFHGNLVDLLEDLNKNDEWRKMYGKTNQRMRDREMILRFFSLYFNYKKYEKPMKGHINKYTGDNRDLSEQSKSELLKLFTNTIEVVYKNIGRKSFGDKGFKAANFDAIMTGVAFRISGKKKQPNKENMQRAYKKLIKNKKFQKFTSEHTSDKDKVLNRIRLATDAFKNT